MKLLKNLLAVTAAAACILSVSVCCFAEPDENDEGKDENYVITTTTGTSAKGKDVVWTQVTEKKQVNGLDNDAVQASVKVNGFEGKKFTAVVDFQSPKHSITYAEGTVGYEKSSFKLVSAAVSEKAGGSLEDVKEEGKYTFKYSNPQGSSYKGEYIVMEFEAIGEEKKDDVLFLTINYILDEQSNAVSFNKTDGMVKLTSTPDVSSDVKTIRLSTNAEPYTFEQLGFKDIINCEIEDSQVAKYSDNGIVAMMPGKVQGKLINKDYSIQKVNIEVFRPDGEAGENASEGTEEGKNDDKKLIPAKKSVNLGVPVLLIIAGAFAYYLTLRRMKIQSIHSPRQTPPRGAYDPRAYSRPVQRRAPYRGAPDHHNNNYPQRRPAPPPSRNIPRDNNRPPYDYY